MNTLNVNNLIVRQVGVLSPERVLCLYEKAEIYQLKWYAETFGYHTRESFEDLDNISVLDIHGKDISKFGEIRPVVEETAEGFERNFVYGFRSNKKFIPKYNLKDQIHYASMINMLKGMREIQDFLKLTGRELWQGVLLSLIPDLEEPIMRGLINEYRHNSNYKPTDQEHESILSRV